MSPNVREYQLEDGLASKKRVPTQMRARAERRVSPCGGTNVDVWEGGEQPGAGASRANMDLIEVPSRA